MLRDQLCLRWKRRPGKGFNVRDVPFVSLMSTELHAKVQNRSLSATIDMLSDNVLLDIFSFCLCDPAGPPLEQMKKWQRLVHVCRRWRQIIFSSPRRLDLRLTCSYGIPVRKNLKFWPVTMPVTIDYPSPNDEANIVAALKHTRRVHRVEIFASPSFLSKVATVMQKSFPALTHLGLSLDWSHLDGLIFPKGFLNESAPCLQYLSLGMFLITEVPTFLLSSHNLITLKLETRFQDNFISPEAMAECLSGMARLKTLSISFWYGDDPVSDLFPMDLTARIILPSLTHFDYVGHSGYSEDLMAQIDAPLLIRLGMSYYGIHRGSQIYVSQLSRFIGHIENFDQPSRAKATFQDGVTIVLDYLHRKGPQASLSIFLIPASNSLSRHILDTADLLDFRLFPAVEVLQLSCSKKKRKKKVLQLSGAVGADIEGTIDEMVTEVLPALHTIWLDNEDEELLEDGPMELQEFLSLRQSFGHPVTIVNTQEELEEKLEKLESHRNGP